MTNGKTGIGELLTIKYYRLLILLRRSIPLLYNKDIAKQDVFATCLSPLWIRYESPFKTVEVRSTFQVLLLEP